jgi:uncharacterized membrane protein
MSCLPYLFAHSGVQHILCCCFYVLFVFVLCTQCYSVSGLSILDCPFGFPNVYFRPVSCVPGVSSVSGLSILDCPFGFL